MVYKFNRPKIILLRSHANNDFNFNKKLEAKHPDFHPKTINGCVSKLLERFTDRVYKPKKSQRRQKTNKPTPQ